MQQDKTVWLQKWVWHTYSQVLKAKYSYMGACIDVGDTEVQVMNKSRLLYLCSYLPMH